MTTSYEDQQPVTPDPVSIPLPIGDGGEPVADPADVVDAMEQRVFGEEGDPVQEEAPPRPEQPPGTEPSA